MSFFGFWFCAMGLTVQPRMTLKVAILLPQPLKCWDNRCVTPHVSWCLLRPWSTLSSQPPTLTISCWFMLAVASVEHCSPTSPPPPAPDLMLWCTFQNSFLASFFLSFHTTILGGVILFYLAHYISSLISIVWLWLFFPSRVHMWKEQKMWLTCSELLRL
jgi:hypothetical protein